MVKNKWLILLPIGVVLLILGVIAFYNYLQVRNAKVNVVLEDSLIIEFAELKKVSDFIKEINGTIIDDYVIDSTILGEKNVRFTFINEDKIKVSYSYQVKIVDTIPPMIRMRNSYTLNKNGDKDFYKNIFCGDNQDAKPNCYIEGEYDVSQVGSYPLVLKAVDKSGNRSEKSFTLHVIEPNEKPKKPNSKEYISFSNIIKEYKKENTKIGLDVSKWQGEIDFEKIKAAGVEFLMIRVGGTRGTNGEYFVDEQFKRNIELANQYNIPVGVYFYSYSETNQAAIKDAKWVLEQIKPYKIDLPIAFDWENWDYFNDFHLSFFGLTEMAKAFLDTIEQAGYKAMLYSSKNFLEDIWYPTTYDIWLAHYTKTTTYQGKYRFWQFCDNGQVDGIQGGVDVNVMYID